MDCSFRHRLILICSDFNIFNLTRNQSPQWILLLLLSFQWVVIEEWVRWEEGCQLTILLLAPWTISSHNHSSNSNNNNSEVAAACMVVQWHLVVWEWIQWWVGPLTVGVAAMEVECTILSITSPVYISRLEEVSRNNLLLTPIPLETLKMADPVRIIVALVVDFDVFLQEEILLRCI